MHKFAVIPVEEVHLQRAPLAKVLMQVQYSRTPELVTDAAESVMADVLGRYPVRRRQLMATAFPSVVVNGQPIQPPAGMVQGAAIALSELTGSWQVTVTDTAVSLETTDYGTRDDFCQRALEIFRAVATVALPPVVDRIGLRYMDRLTGARLPRIHEFVIPQLQSLYGLVDRPLGIHHSITDSLIEIGPTERLQVRSGLLPAGSGFDPALPVIKDPSWVLDMDVYTIEGGFAFDADELTERLRRYAEIIYAFFRFATTDAFQEEHIGEPSATVRDAQ